jgi:hypothetical protein
VTELRPVTDDARLHTFLLILCPLSVFEREPNIPTIFEMMKKISFSKQAYNIRKIFRSKAINFSKFYGN